MKRPISHLKNMTPDQMSEFALAVLTEFSKVDVMYDANEVLISRIITPILANGAKFPISPGAKARFAMPTPCNQIVIQCTFIAIYMGEAMAVMGYLTQERARQEASLKRELVEAMRLQWKVFEKKQKAVSA